MLGLRERHRDGWLIDRTRFPTFFPTSIPSPRSDDGLALTALSLGLSSPGIGSDRIRWRFPFTWMGIIHGSQPLTRAHWG